MADTLESLCRELVEKADQTGLHDRFGRRNMALYLINPFLPRLRAVLRSIDGDDDGDAGDQPAPVPSGDSPSDDDQSLALDDQTEDVGVRDMPGLEGPEAAAVGAEGDLP